ncbi:MAG: tetratricopeptide repeat protein [Deltaproteobacteria bacterium]|jgi:predicted Zn-dependent protease|nr:tetratricopeptide repeat protein [Deltaproteobacteria bacterium]
MIFYRPGKSSQPISLRRNRRLPFWRSDCARGATQGRSRRWLAWGLVLAVLACGSDPEARLEGIRSQQELGDFAATVAPLRELLEANPEDPELNHLYGVALLGVGRPELAIWPLRKAAQEPDRAIEDGVLLSQALLRGGSASDAVQEVLRVLELAPDRVDVARLLLQTRLKARQHEEALEAAALVLELKPDDPEALVGRLAAYLALQRAEEAEQALVAFGEVVEDLPEESQWHARFCAGTASFASEKGEVEAAEAAWEECLEKFPGEELVVFTAMEFFNKQSKHARALEILRSAHQANPTHLNFVETLANWLATAGRAEEAERLLRSAAARDGGKDPDAWLLLARYHERRDETTKAKDALAQGMRLMGEAPVTLVAAYVDLLIRSGDYDEAEELLPQFDPSPVMQNMLRGRLILARGKPAEALEVLDEGLRLWPDHSVGHWLAGTAAEQLGDFERAVQEYGEAIRNDPGNRDALLSMLKLLEGLGLYDDALTVLSRSRHENRKDAEILLHSIRIAHRAGSQQILEQAARQLGALPGNRSVVVAELAAIHAARGGPSAGVDAIRGANLDLTHPRNGPALGALVEFLVEADRSGEALEAIRAALEAHPDEALFHDLRGRVLRGAGETQAAQEAIQRALELEPERASALAQLAALAKERGDRDAALALYDRAALADPEDASYAWNAIELLSASDDGAELERRLEALLARHATHAAAAELLARRLSERDPDRALALALRAVRLAGGPGAFDVLGRIQLAQGDAESAARSLGASVRLRPDSPSSQYWLGRALIATEDEEGARRALEASLELGAFPEREVAQAELARLNGD